jgi:hypothetical protein
LSEERKEGTIMPKQSFADVMTDWEKLLATVAANKDELLFIDGYKQQLEVEMAGAKTASLRQSASQADSQQASRDLEGFLTRGSDLASRMRTGIKTQYGIRGEKLKEFGLKVFRGRKKAVKPPPVVTPPAVTPPTVTPPTSGTHPAETKPALQVATSEAQNPS